MLKMERIYRCQLSQVHSRFFQDGTYLAMSSVAGTFKVLAFVTVLLVLQIKNQLD